MQNQDAKAQLIKELAKECRTVEDIQEKLKELFRDTIQGLLEAEMDHHLGYAKHSSEGDHSGNSRNGYSTKIIADLKKIYQAATLEEAEQAFSAFKDKWGKKHPIITRSWENNWLELTAYFGYPPAIRKLIYTTNIIEGYHRQLRKVTKTKTAYPSDDALRKIIYLPTMEISKKWTMPLREWKDCISQLVIYFGDRLQAELSA